LLITIAAFIAVLTCGVAGVFGIDHQPPSHEVAASGERMEANLRAYCMRSRELFRNFQLLAHERACRFARRLLA
jgi:hypothetical protein